jgi:cytochrome c553
MMKDSPAYSWRDVGLRRSVLALVAITIVAGLVGFVWLPAGKADYAAQGVWASICRAAGVPDSWGDDSSKGGTSDSVGRGATLALNCTMCHGAQGLSSSDAPNLAGQYPEVLIKQLHDYKTALRASPIMEALSRNLTDRNIEDLAAYYAYLPKARNAPTTYADALPALVRDGAPMRNIAPCVACHGSVDQKLGAPWLEGMPKDYLVAQLTKFRAETRRNDSHSQMRNMARAMTTGEIADVAEFYAGRGPAR